MEAASGMENLRLSPAMPYFATILITFLLAVPAMSVELFRYRGAAKDGGTLEYIFETDEQDVPKTVSKEKAAEIAADFVTTFYHAQIGALETQEFRTQPVPFWLVCFSDTIKGPMRQIFFVVLLPDGRLLSPGWRSGCSHVQGCLKRCKIRATVAPCQTKKIKCLSIYGAIFWKGN